MSSLPPLASRLLVSYSVLNEKTVYPHPLRRSRSILHPSFPYDDSARRMGGRRALGLYETQPPLDLHQRSL